jgi:hypothetical protein
MFPPLFETIAADATVVALFGDPPRVFPFGEAPSGVARPYAVWQLVYGAPENYISDTPDADSFGTQIDVYSPDAAETREAARALRSAIETVAHLASYNGEFRDPVTRDYRCSFTVDWIAIR